MKKIFRWFLSRVLTCVLYLMHVALLLTCASYNYVLFYGIVMIDYGFHWIVYRLVLIVLKMVFDVSGSRRRFLYRFIRNNYFEIYFQFIFRCVAFVDRRNCVWLETCSASGTFWLRSVMFIYSTSVIDIGFEFVWFICYLFQYVFVNVYEGFCAFCVFSILNIYDLLGLLGLEVFEIHRFRYGCFTFSGSSLFIATFAYNQCFDN